MDNPGKAALVSRADLGSLEWSSHKVEMGEPEAEWNSTFL